MHEKSQTKEFVQPRVRRINEDEPVYFASNRLKEGDVAMVGSLYLGDATDAQSRQEFDEEHRRLDIIDLRSAPIVNGLKVYGSERFDAAVKYLVTQGQPDWQNGVGYKGIRSGDILTIGRKDPITSKRFNLSDPQISRSHATIYETEEGLIIEDNNSANGTSYVKYNIHEQDTLPAVETVEVTQPTAREMTARTESNLARVIDDTELANWQLYMNETKGSQYPSVQNLLSHPELAPVTGVELDKKTFLFSAIMQSEHRKFVVGYVSGPEQPGKLMPRLFYRSESDGGWRATPYIYPNGIISKGAPDSLKKENEYGHYVQITKPNEDIIAVLERQDRLQEQRKNEGDIRAYPAIEYRDLKDWYGKARLKDEAHLTFNDEVKLTEVRGRFMDAYISGVGASDESTLDAKMSAMELPVGFEPDFTVEPLKKYRTKHSIAGATEVEVFPAVFEGRKIEWHVAHDVEQKRVWIDKITYQDSGVTSYGTQQEVILAGALSAKPFDYMDHFDGMRVNRDWVSISQSYGDASPTLDKIPAIRHYRLSRGIYRDRK